MMIIPVVFLLQTFLPLGRSAVTVTIYNTFQDEIVTQGRESIYDAAGPTEIDSEIEFPLFPAFFHGEGGFYDIDVDSDSITFTLIDSSGATNLVFPDGTFDRYYILFDSAIEFAEIDEQNTDISSRVEILQPGSELDFVNTFNFDIRYPPFLEHGGILVKIGNGADLTELGQQIVLTYELGGMLYSPEIEASVIKVWNSFQDSTVTRGIESIYDKGGPIGVSDSVEFPLFPKFFQGDGGFYDIDIQQHSIIYTLIDSSGATHLVFPDDTFDRYYFEFGDVIAQADLDVKNTDISTRVEVLPPGYVFDLPDMFGLGIETPPTLEHGGILVKIGNGADLTELGQKIVLTYSLEKEYFGLASDDSERGGCLAVKDSETEDGTPLILGTCGGMNRLWRYQDGLFHSRLDDRKCIQAGYGGSPEEGTKLRLFTCDPESALQKFYYDDVRIELIRENLCLVFRGSNGHVDIDPIILKSCDESDGQDNWSWDETWDGSWDYEGADRTDRANLLPRWGSE